MGYWQKDGNHLTVCDQQPAGIPDGVACQTGPDYLRNLDQFDLLIRTPGLHPADIAKANPGSPNILDKVTTVTNEFLKVCPSRNIIGITGTKGKGTTSSLVAELLKAAGKTIHLGGNIGVAPLEMLKNNIQPDDWVILELSSFQLIDIKKSPRVATCLMVVPEHLNWHNDMDEYVTAKQQLFAYQTETDLAIYNRGNPLSEKVVSVSAATKISYEVPVAGAEPQVTSGAYLNNDTIFMNETAVCKVSDIALIGRHNLENVCAAIATTWEIINHDSDLVQKVIREFKGLEHRLELVREVNNVKYYDDSFGTTPDTAIVAIQAFKEPKVVILGGSDKQATFDELAHVVASGNVRSVVLIGKTAPAIQAALQTAGYTSFVPGGTTMASIVAAAQAQAQPGDVVLLSTACASFDLFANYQERGEQFKLAVQSL